MGVVVEWGLRWKLLPILITWRIQNQVHLSDWERRPSTKKASESLLEKQRIREEIMNSKKESNNLKK